MDIIARYYVETDLNIKEAAGAIAAEQSTGTWTQISTLKEGDPAHQLDAKVLSAKGTHVEIGFPVELFEPGNIPQYLSVIAGNLFGLGALNNVRLLDVEFPEALIKAHKGPRYGIKEARKIIDIYDRPLVGTIIKPKVGLTPTQTAQVAYEAALGGLDLIKDDETLTNQSFCPVEERVTSVMDKLDKAEAQTGQKVFYAVNVTTGAAHIVERAQTVIDLGANMVMVDVLTAGFDALQELSTHVDVPIHVHRTMHGAITKNKRHGIAMLVLSKLVRIAGGTNLHTGSYKGKMDTDTTENDLNRDALTNEWFGLKPVFPVASGGISPLNVAPSIEGYGVDCIVQAGGGVHGHPDGTKEGARAMRQAVDAWLKGVSVREYAKDHLALKRAIEKWGVSAPY
jgi:ribulose-bisphosphate carboxylase large chain